MTHRLIFAFGYMSLVCVGGAFALDEFIVLKPGDGHASVTAERTDNGRVRFTITRDPAKNPKKKRQGWLTLSGEAGFLAECAVESKERAGNLTFSFELASGTVRHSKFTLNEVMPTREGEELQVGGATILEFRLADFMPDGSN